MGLDMCLLKRKKFRENDDAYNALARKASEELMHWGKANQIRQWFVNHTELQRSDNNRYIPLAKETLISLRDDCNKVCANHELAEELMPTSSGYYFGAADYDDVYFSRLEYTAECIDEILEYVDFETEDIDYYESW